MPDDPRPASQPPEEGSIAPTPSSNPGVGSRSDPAQPRGRPRRAGVQQLFEALEKEAPEQAKLVTNAAGIKLALVPAGTFPMGSDVAEKLHRLNETPQHEVAITQPLYVAVHLVTQRQYHQIMGGNPARFHPSAGGTLEHPVERVSWDDAAEFCRRLSHQPSERQAGRVYRLPTEAEWEYACRAGTTTLFSGGSALNATLANFDGRFPCGEPAAGKCLGKTTPVGAFPANNFGLYDMHGNVWEWCADWYDDTAYRHSARRDPQGPSSGRFRVARGGSWRNHAVTCRAAYRNGLVPHNRDPYTGFRVVAAASAAALSQCQPGELQTPGF